MKRRALRPALAAALVAVGALVFAGGCGGPAAGGQSSLAQRTFAGQNKCNPKNADRPFVIEWDATDQSSFQSQSASDVVFVHYEGCEMRVLNGCRDDSVKGSFGSYKAVEWTSGGVESVDIHDEGELFAKLPLGAASLGGRVQSGERFHMEYYVSGTRTATRDRVFRGDLAANKACATATHFVYAYNLGAFALASSSSLKGEVNGSYFGFGAGAKKATESSADKKGGELSSCRGESAHEVESCKVPVRLTLREIADGADPTAAATHAPDTDASLNLAGRLQARGDAERNAAAHLDAANAKKQAGDGAGCLAELDQHDTLDPRPSGLSTAPASAKIAGLRAECLMLSGRCGPGKALLRQAISTTKGGEIGPDRVDQITEAESAAYCRGNAISPREQYLRALSELRNGGLGLQKKTVLECQTAFDTFLRLRPSVAPNGPDDRAVPARPFDAMGMPAPACFAKAGDCAAAYRAYKRMNDAKSSGESPARDEITLRLAFEGLVPACKGK